MLSAAQRSQKVSMERGKLLPRARGRFFTSHVECRKDMEEQPSPEPEKLRGKANGNQFDKR